MIEFFLFEFNKFALIAQLKKKEDEIMSEKALCLELWYLNITL